MSGLPTIEIRDFAFGGEALGNLPDGRVCFVRGAAPGETVEVEVTEIHRNYCRGKLARIVGGNSARIEAECPYFSECPGCAYLHVPYEVELAAKARQLDSFINRHREVPVKLAPIFPSPTRLAWRNRIRLHADGSGKLGYQRSDDGGLIPIDRCLLMRPEINAKLPEVAPPPGFCGTIGIDHDARSGAVVTTDSAGSRSFGELGEFGVFAYPTGGFFQTNSAVAAELARRVAKIVTEKRVDFLVELYCGVGIFSLICAAQNPALRTLGVESYPAAVRCANSNAKVRDLAENCRFVVGDASSMKRHLRGRRPQLLLVDPPRGGLSLAVIRDILELAPPDLIYISCSADTLCRDLRQLEKVYELKSGAALDMFPGTAHFETLTLLEKRA